MIGNIKTAKTVTFTCCVCKMKLQIDAETILQAELVAKENGWGEDKYMRPICADCLVDYDALA